VPPSTAAGLLATTSDIANSDFMAGNYKFGLASPNSTAGIVNNGTITTPGGSTVLAAPTVDNGGTIDARLGTVALGAGKTFSVDFNGVQSAEFSRSPARRPAPGSTTPGHSRRMAARFN